MKSKYTPILIEWEDFAQDLGWQGSGDIVEALKSPYLVRSVGFLVAANKDRIILSLGYCLRNDDDAFQDIIKVPTSSIRKIVFLGEKKNAPKKVGCLTSIKPASRNHKR